MNKKSMKKNFPQSQIIIYKTEDGQTKIDVRFDGETVWLTLEKMAQLFDKAKSTINEHILNIYSEGELAEGLTIQKIGNSDFLVKPTHYYNLDVIISVGYRVKSAQGTRFRQWATKRLGEYLVFAEGQALQRIPMRMADWIERLHEFLQINRKDILKDAGRISHELAKEQAEKEYDLYYKKRLQELNKTDVAFDEFAVKAKKLMHNLKSKKK